MAKTYIGVGGTAHQVSKIYVGVGGLAHQVQKAYIGDADGKAQLVYQLNESRWWLLTGYSASDVYAAYRFKGAASQSAALTDLTGNSRNLSKVLGTSSTITWTSGSGMYFPSFTPTTDGLTNDFLKSNVDSIQSACYAWEYSGYTNNAHIGGIGITNGSTTAVKKGLYLGINSYAYELPVTGSFSFTSSSLVGSAAGVLSANFTDSKVYKNGTELSRSGTFNYQRISNSTSVIGNIGYGSEATHPWYLRAAVFYSTALTATQHAELAANIAALWEE